MKLSGKRIDAFLKAPAADVVAVLVFGPESSLIHERVAALVAAVAGVPADPFRFVELPALALRSDPARLTDEAAALSFSGGRRLVRVRDAGDALTAAFSQLLSGAGAGAPGLVVAEAGDLGKRSSLRLLFEGASAAAAIACYAEDAASLRTVIRDTLTGQGLSVDGDALDFLSVQLGANRAVTRAELEKLSLYMGGPGRVTLGDAMAAVGDSAALSLGAIVTAAGAGDFGTLDKALQTAFAEGASPVAIVRVAAQHITRLVQAQALVAAGKTPDQAMMSLKPPVIFHQKPAFLQQMRHWSRPRLGQALNVLTDAELAGKTTGAPALALATRALLQVAHAARSGGGRS